MESIVVALFAGQRIKARIQPNQAAYLVATS